MATVLFLLWLVMSVVIIDAKDKTGDPEFSEIVKAAKKDLEKFIEENALGGFESVHLRTNGEKSSEERDVMDQKIQIMDLPPDFEVMPTEPSTPVIESLTSAVESLPLEQMDEGTPSFSKYRRQIVSIKGIPGVHFPDYTDIPKTSFSCADKPYLPGFYADLDTGCQVFHVCWNDRRETLLCPMGTTFNQALMACDHWYNSDCSLTPRYYYVNEGKKFDGAQVQEKDDLVSMLDLFLGSKTGKSVASSKEGGIPATVLSFVTQFMPVKAKVILYAESERQRSETRDTIVESSYVGKDKRLTHKEKSHRVRDVSSIQSSLKALETLEELRNVDYKLDENFKSTLEKFIRLGSVTDYENKPKCEGHVKPILNPRFITKPVTKKLAADIKGELSRLNLSESSVQEKSKFHKVKSSTRVTISEKTKKALLFNYIRLIKIKATRSY